MGRLARRVAPKPGLALALGTGLLGGFTTYSAFAVETVQLAQGAHLALAVGYAAASVLGGVAAAGLGLTLGQRR
jgi:CrcB protein